MWISDKKDKDKKEKSSRIKTNNQELLIRKQNESDATSRWKIKNAGLKVASDVCFLIDEAFPLFSSKRLKTFTISS